MRFRFCNVEHGWMDIEVQTTDTSYKLCVSDVLTDCVVDLLQAAIFLHKGNDIAQVMFWGEPATDTWHIIRDGETLRIKHYWHSETLIGHRTTIIDLNVSESDLGQLQDETTVNLSDFTNEVIRFVSSIPDMNDLEKYESTERWGKPFPSEAYEQLKELRRAYRASY